jgi:hypothetical protein
MAGKGDGAPRCQPCDPRPVVQLRDPSRLTSEEYVAQKGWLKASLERCPVHPEGGCGFSAYGTYGRKTPAGMQIARCYCPQARRTFSLLPDCLASRLSGSLDELEAVVERVEGARSVEAAADELRPEIELPGAVRWVRRRLKLVRATLVALVTLMPDVLGGEAHLGAVRLALGNERALVALRERGADHLARLPHPLGFLPPSTCGSKREQASQHNLGPDPPADTG